MQLKKLFSGRGVVGAALSLSVATTGSGVLAIPSTFQDGGICLVFGVLAFVGVLTIFSIDYLIRCVDCLHLRSYEDISRELLGRWCEEMVRWILIVYNVGVSAGYIVVVGEIFTPMLPLIQPYVPFLTDSWRVMLMVWLFVMLPLSCIPQITKLNYISYIAITATFLISGIIVYRYVVPFDGQRNTAPITYFSLSERSFLAVPVMMFSFDCQSLIFQVYSNLETVTRSNMIKVATVSVVVTGSIYAIVGLFGYLSNTPHITGNILANYNPLKDRLFAIGEVAYSFTVIMAYALVLFPSRDAVLILILGYNTATQTSVQVTGRQSLTVSIVLSTLSILLALRATSVVFIIALLGGMCSSTMCFTYPAVFRLMLHARGLDRCTLIELAIAVCMLIFGVVGGAVSTFVAIQV
ncbi:amino acid permease [Novymonas esmeraldas]|uniref:Amino acid permease n=1 Tax=Novymonas esmeraldas TaxID=1808958 RepID=A0AAW0EZI1_9TRYP